MAGKPNEIQPYEGSPWLRGFLLVCLCCYPVIGARYLPFGDSGRYMSVLAGPLSLLFLLTAGARQWRAVLSEALHWALPFLPFLLAYIATVIWHGNAFDFQSALTRVLYGALIFTAGRILGVRTRHLVWAAAIGCALYLLAGLVELVGYKLGYSPLPNGRSSTLAEDGHLRVSGGGGNPIHFADVSMWLIGLSVLGCVVLRSCGSKIRGFFLVAGIAGLLACLLSGSRGALLALLPLSGLLLARVPLQRRALAVALCSMAMVTLVMLLVFYPPLSDRLWLAWLEVQRYYTEPAFTFTSVGARLEMWRIALRVLHESPWLGGGFVSYAKWMIDFPFLGKINSEILLLPHLHNDFMQSLAIGGLVLLAGQLLTWGWLFVRARANPFMMWLLFAWLAFGLTDLVSHTNLMLTFLISGWALFAAAASNEQ